MSDFPLFCQMFKNIFLFYFNCTYEHWCEWSALENCKASNISFPPALASERGVQISITEERKTYDINRNDLEVKDGQHFPLTISSTRMGFNSLNTSTKICSVMLFANGALISSKVKGNIFLYVWNCNKKTQHPKTIIPLSIQFYKRLPQRKHSQRQFNIAKR